MKIECSCARPYVFRVSLLAKMLGVFVATTNPPAATVSNAIADSPAAALVAPAEPVDADYQKLLATDDAAHAEVDRWIRDNQEFRAQGGGVPDEELNRRIEERLKSVRQDYENFLATHTNHALAHLAYGSFLDGVHEEELSVAHMEKSRELDPKNPAAWNNLANYYGHRSPVKKAFEYYAKAIELNPYESVYYHNFGTTVYLFRKDAMEHFDFTEQQVYDKALELYAHAMDLDPEDFPLATDVAQTYYGIAPFRGDAALTAWTNALKLARDDDERQGVELHFARVKLKLKKLNEVQAHLDAVTLPRYEDLKARLRRNLIFAQEKPLTNAVPDEPIPAKLWNTNALPPQIYRLK
jgi:tetratricopeptide (TPR) repeat protein